MREQARTPPGPTEGRADDCWRNVGCALSKHGGAHEMKMASWRRERLAKTGGLRGVGLEIGAGVRPTITDADVEMKYLDFYSTEELQSRVGKHGSNPADVVPVDYVAHSEDYRGCVD